MLICLKGLQTAPPVRNRFHFGFSLTCLCFSPSQGSDWVLPSSKLTLRKVSASDGGRYSCMAEHPSVNSLSKKRTVSITVLPGKKRPQIYLDEPCHPLFRLNVEQLFLNSPFNEPVWISFSCQHSRRKKKKSVVLYFLLNHLRKCYQKRSGVGEQLCHWEHKWKLPFV